VQPYNIQEAAGTEATMRKAFDYLEHAEECRKIANQMRNPQHKERLEELAQEWEMLAKEWARELARAAKQTSQAVVEY
jgi:hypothetical protein